MSIGSICHSSGGLVAYGWLGASCIKSDGNRKEMAQRKSGVAKFDGFNYSLPSFLFLTLQNVCSQHTELLKSRM